VIELNGQIAIARWDVSSYDAAGFKLRHYTATVQQCMAHQC